jgi:hypothetical protein
LPPRGMVESRSSEVLGAAWRVAARR